MRRTAEKQKAAREVSIPLKREQVAALMQMQQAIAELQGKLAAFLTGITTGQGISECGNARLDTGKRVLTVTVSAP